MSSAVFFGAGAAQRLGGLPGRSHARGLGTPITAYRGRCGVVPNGSEGERRTPVGAAKPQPRQRSLRQLHRRAAFFTSAAIDIRFLGPLPSRVSIGPHPGVNPASQPPRLGVPTRQNMARAASASLSGQKGGTKHCRNRANQGLRPPRSHMLLIVASDRSCFASIGGAATSMD